MRKLLLPLTVLVMAGCQPAGDSGAMSEAVDLTPVISARTASFATVFNGGNADSLAMFYTENATLMPPNMAPLHGREEIKAFRPQMEMPNMSTRLELTTQSVTSQGPLAIERGSYVATMTPTADAPEGMTAIADSGSFLVHWHEVDGQWLIVDDMWVSSLPPQPAMEPSTKTEM